MGHPTRIGFFLAFLVLGVYVMRNADISVGTTSTRAFRSLYALLNGTPTWYSSAGQTICPDINIDSPFTDSEVSAAASARTGIQGMRGGNPLKTTLQSGSLNNFVSDYAVGLAPLAGAWIVLFAITYLICCSLCCSWCCMHGCCKKTKCCKCCKQPQIFKKKWIYVGVTVVMLLGMFSAGIAGASFSGKIPKGMQVTLCSFIGMVEDFITGIPSAHWMGLSGVVNSLTTIYNLYDAALTSMGATSDAVTQVKTDRDNTLTTLQALYTNRKDNTVARPDPNAATATYIPDYVKTNTLGPETTTTTVIGTIYGEMDAQYQILKTAQDAINPAVQSLNTNKNTIKDGIDSGKGVVNSVKDAMDNFLKTLGDIGSTVNDIFGAVGSALVAVFVVFIVISVLVILSILVIIKKKVKFLNKFLHFSWCLLILLNLITWIVSAIFYPISVVMMEACDVLDSLLTDPVSRSSMLGSITTGATVDVFNSCLNAKDAADPSADFAAPFKLEDSLKDFNSIFTQLDAVSQPITLPGGAGTVSFTISGTSGNTGPASVAIPPQITAVNNIIAGTLVDSQNIVTDLAQLNRLVNKNTAGSCTNLLDSWALTSSACSGTKFAAGNADTFGKNSQICMGFVDIWIPNGKSATNRYSGEFGTCSNVGATPANTYITNLANNFVTNRNAIKALFDTGATSVRGYLATVNTQYTTFMNDVGGVLNNFGKVKVGLQNIQDALYGSSNGVLKNLKCGFVKADLLRISNGMCVGFVANLYQTSVALIVTSFFTLFSAVAIFLLAKRILLPEYMAAKTSPSGFSPPGNQFSPY